MERAKLAQLPTGGHGGGLAIAMVALRAAM